MLPLADWNTRWLMKRTYATLTHVFAISRYTQHRIGQEADADCFLMLSISHGHHFEGYGLVFLEANARGVPAIGPRDSGCENAIEDGRSGYLVHPQNPAEVAERLKWVLEEERIKPEECKTWAKEHSMERQAEEAERVYRTLLC